LLEPPGSSTGAHSRQFALKAAGGTSHRINHDFVVEYREFLSDVAGWRAVAIALASPPAGADAGVTRCPLLRASSLPV